MEKKVIQQPVEEKSKKGVWIVIIIVLVLLIFGLGVFFFLKSKGNGGILGEKNIIPQPIIIKTNENSLCSDTDDGINYLIKGKVNSCEGPEGEVRLCEKLEDHCGKNNNLIEAYCDGDIGRLRSFKCPNGCEEGACISDLTPKCDEFLTFSDNEEKVIYFDDKEYKIKAHIESEDKWASFSVNGDYGPKGKHYSESWGNMLMVPGTNLYVSNSVIILNLKISLREVGYDTNQEEFAKICIIKQ
jgi:hypothetical protein